MYGKFFGKGPLFMKNFDLQCCKQDPSIYKIWILGPENDSYKRYKINKRYRVPDLLENYFYICCLLTLPCNVYDDEEVSTVGDKEWYFFCIRGRKYRNSIRPNRVTGSGFWKATGIDKPIHSAKEPHECIGLKKSLVYYRGSAGKGTKTDWMMHEFRLPPNGKTTNFSNTKDIAQEAVRFLIPPFIIY